MLASIAAVRDLLNSHGTNYNFAEHRAVYTIDDMQELNLPEFDAVAKNLFVRDDKKRNYYLIVVRHEKKVELKALSEKIGSTKLSFASENDLLSVLGLQKGAVTPFGILNDETRKVKVIFDKSFNGLRIGVHPNENTATVFLATADLIDIIKQHGNSVVFMEV